MTPVPIGCAVPTPPENPVTVAEMAHETPPPCCSSVYGHREPSSASVSLHDPGSPCCSGTQGPSTLNPGGGALELDNPGGSQRPATLAPYPNSDAQQPADTSSDTCGSKVPATPGPLVAPRAGAGQKRCRLKVRLPNNQAEPKGNQDLVLWRHPLGNRRKASSYQPQPRIKVNKACLA